MCHNLCLVILHVATDTDDVTVLLYIILLSIITLSVIKLLLLVQSSTCIFSTDADVTMVTRGHSQQWMVDYCQHQYEK